MHSVVLHILSVIAAAKHVRPKISQFTWQLLQDNMNAQDGREATCFEAAATTISACRVFATSKPQNSTEKRTTRCVEFVSFSLTAL
jgi:hypothetical protein